MYWNKQHFQSSIAKKKKKRKIERKDHTQTQSFAITFSFSGLWKTSKLVERMSECH